MKKLTPILLAVLACGFQHHAHAAGGVFTASPYGSAVWAESVADMGRGGTGMAYLDSMRINVRNPAVFHTGRRTRFQLGFALIQDRFETADDSDTESRGAIGNYALGLPLVWQNVSAGIGMRPVTHMEYASAVRDTDDAGREYVNSRKGEGGFSLVHLTFSRGFLDQRLHLGLELGLVFGSMLEEWKVYYPSYAPPYDTWLEYRNSLSGFRPRLGLHWQQKATSFGMAWTPKASVNHRIDLENVAYDVDEQFEVGDTNMPMMVEAGVAHRWKRLQVSADMSYTDMDGVDLGQAPDQLRDTAMGFALGLEYHPIDDITLPLYRRLILRTGFRFEEEVSRFPSPDQSGIFDDLSSWQISCGLGVPLRKPGTWLDLALCYGAIGDTGENGIENQWWSLGASVTARDLWFHRPKY